LTFVTAVSCNT